MLTKKTDESISKNWYVRNCAPQVYRLEHMYSNFALEHFQGSDFKSTEII